jgi:hypothetical protein
VALGSAQESNPTLSASFQIAAKHAGSASLVTILERFLLLKIVRVPKPRGQAAPELAPQALAYSRIPIPQDLVAAIVERQRQNPGGKLIFPNDAGNPDEHLLRIVQRVARNAGGSFHADLHTFRRTTRRCFQGQQRFKPSSIC